LEDAEYESVTRQAESDDAKRAVVMTVAQADGVKPKAAPMDIPGKPTQANALLKVEVVEDEDEAPAPKAKAPKAKPVASEDDEPEVRKAPSKETAVPAKKSKLADIVSDWDDE
jgi:hypothetical protein